ncbi:MAG: 16S rRNA (cytidine(1402)-2'-O)-methyltransferase, partial [Thermomicrobia bacterium]|nr:16S rRNA (cytidine(1402)-2'-O)-methyltransferase [Thermomicrobia bacterium]
AEAVAGCVERSPRGEYVVIITAAPVASLGDVVDDAALDALLSSLLESGCSPAAAAKEAAATTGIDRGSCYQCAVAIKRRVAG